METGKIIKGDCLEVMKDMPDESVDMVLTSPPYYGLRDYGEEEQIGLEETFEEYLQRLLAVTEQCKRVLKPKGTLWWVHGDSYSNGNISKEHQVRTRMDEIPHKSLTMQPYRLAQRMVDDQDWILRNIIIWHKPSCMPSSAKDRFTVDYEPVLFFSKNKKYYFEQQFTPYTKPLDRWGGDKLDAKGKSEWDEGTGQSSYRDRDMRPDDRGRNKRTLWSINPKPFPEAHFAVYPPTLITTPIKAGCPEGGIVLDPFFGAGTTGLVAQRLNRNYIGIELNEDYIKIAENRLKQDNLL